MLWSMYLQVYRYLCVWTKGLHICIYNIPILVYSVWSIYWFLYLHDCQLRMATGLGGSYKNKKSHLKWCCIDMRPVFHGSLCVERSILRNDRLKKPPTLSVIFQIFTLFAHLRHMISRRKVLWRDLELHVSHFPFSFQVLIARGLISLGLCWFAHLRFMCKYACGMCARLGLLITKCALSVFKYTQSTSTDTPLWACIFASSLESG